MLFQLYYCFEIGDPIEKHNTSIVIFDVQLVS